MTWKRASKMSTIERKHTSTHTQKGPQTVYATAGGIGLNVLSCCRRCVMASPSNNTITSAQIDNPIAMASVPSCAMSLEHTTPKKENILHFSVSINKLHLWFCIVSDIFSDKKCLKSLYY